MFKEEDDDYLEIVTLTGDDGISYTFQVIEEIELEGKTYLITIPEDNYDTEELVIIQDLDSILTIVDDQEILDKIQEHIEQITLDQDISSITLLGKDGKRYEYEVVDKINLNDKKYIFTVDINSKSNNYVIFEVTEQNLNMIEDKELYDELVINLDNRADYRYYASDYDYEDTKITLQDADDNIIEMNILGKLEIKNNKYLIGQSKSDSKKLIAILVDDEEISLIKDPKIIDEVNHYLKKIREVIDKKNFSYPELN